MWWARRRRSGSAKQSLALAVESQKLSTTERGHHTNCWLLRDRLCAFTKISLGTLSESPVDETKPRSLACIYIHTRMQKDHMHALRSCSPHQGLVDSGNAKASLLALKVWEFRMLGVIPEFALTGNFWYILPVRISMFWKQNQPLVRHTSCCFAWLVLKQNQHNFFFLINKHSTHTQRQCVCSRWGKRNRTFATRALVQ